MGDNKLAEEQDKSLQTLISYISNVKKINNQEKFNELMSDLNLKAKTMPLSTIQRFSILFYSYYNHLTFQNQNKDTKMLTELSNYMINNLQDKKILSLIQGQINKNFSNKFNYHKILEKKEKDGYEVSFSICLLSKNIKLMEVFFKEYLNVNIFEENDFNTIDLENPFANELFDSLFINIYDAIKSDQKDNIKIIIQNCLKDSELSLNKLFHCNKCYDFMMMKFDEKNIFKVKCLNCSKKFHEYKNDEYKSAFTCVECGKNIILFKQNYKCTKCKKILCSQCINNHCNNCFTLRFIKLYEVGYKCEIHNSKYIYYCFTCKKNLCNSCKDIHPHITKKIINIDEKVKDLFTNLHILKGIMKKNLELIKYRLSFLYLKNRKNKQFNGFIYEILCEILNIDLKKKNKDILFTKFNGEEFNKYYSKLIKDASEGKTYSLNRLEFIKSYYQKKNIIEFKIDYNIIMNNQIYIRNFIEKCKLIWMELIKIHTNINYDDKINDLKNSNNNLKIKIDELDTKLLINNHSDNIYKNNTNNILCRFLADELIQLIITKYSNKLNEISLNFSIFIDLFSNSEYNVLSDSKIINSILGLSTNLNKNIEAYNKSDNKEIKENLKKKIVDYLSPFYKILFNDDIAMGQDIFKKEELNQILDILFFVKNKGNITAHPNIDLDQSLKMINKPTMPLKFEIDYFYNSSLKEKIEKEISKNLGTLYNDNLPVIIKEDKDIYYKLNNVIFEKEDKYNLFKNIKDYKDGVMGDVIEKIRNTRDDILSRFEISKLKKDVQTKDIIETIFEGKSNKIFEGIKEFQKVFISNTDDVIKKYLNIDLEKKLSQENKNFNELIKALEKLHLIFKHFIQLNIPRHSSLEIYINKIIDKSKFDYSSFIYEIIDLEQEILKEHDMEIDCENNEIIVEAYFLLMIKTYENEKKLIKEIKKKYETELIKIIINEEIEQKLNELIQYFEKEFNDTSFKLTKLINDNFFTETNANKITFERMKHILNKLLDCNISLGESKN